jgi:hypothetical protein
VRFGQRERTERGRSLSARLRVHGAVRTATHRDDGGAGLVQQADRSFGTPGLEVMRERCHYSGPGLTRRPGSTRV